MKFRGVLCRLCGGLGNQMCCYAVARWFSVQNGQELLLDHSSGFLNDSYARKPLLKNFNITGQDIPTSLSWNSPAVRFERWFIRSLQKYIGRRNSSYIFGKYTDSDALRGCLGMNKTVLEGVWIDHEIFNGVRDLLLDELAYKGELFDESQHVLTKIKAAAQQSVSLHLRSYKETPRHASEEGWQISYLRDATKMILQKLESPVFFVFSDDFEYAKETLGKVLTPGQTEYVDCNSLRGDQGSLEDFELMRSCAHQIIDYSTFSWWAAWLNDYENKNVFAPTKWEENMPYSMPEGWVVL